MTALRCDPAIAAENALCCQRCSFSLPLSSTAPRAAAAGPGGQEMLMPRNPDHFHTQPRALLFPPIPTSLDVFSPFALHLPIQNFCWVTLHGRTLTSSQGFQGAPAPRQDGEPPSERCLGSQEGRKSEPCPAPPAVSLRRDSQALSEQKCSGKSLAYGYPKVRQVHPCIIAKFYSWGAEQ